MYVLHSMLNRKGYEVFKLCTLYYPACLWGQIPVVWGRWRGRDTRRPLRPASAAGKPSDTHSPDSEMGFPVQSDSRTAEEDPRRETNTQEERGVKITQKQGTILLVWVFVSQHFIQPCRGQCHNVIYCQHNLWISKVQNTITHTQTHIESCYRVISMISIMNMKLNTELPINELCTNTQKHIQLQNIYFWWNA